MNKNKTGKWNNNTNLCATNMLRKQRKRVRKQLCAQAHLQNLWLKYIKRQIIKCETRRIDKKTIAFVNCWEYIKATKTIKNNSEREQNYDFLLHKRSKEGDNRKDIINRKANA